MDHVDPSNPTPADFERLAAYFAGEITPDERELVARWAAALPDRAVLMERLASVWARLAPPPVANSVIEARVDAVLWQVHAGVAPREATGSRDVVRGVTTAVPRMTAFGRTPVGPRTAQQRFVWRAVTATAAAVVVAAAAAVVPWFLARSGAESDARAARTYATGTGQRATLRLADGSRVTLAPQTRLVIPRGFGGLSGRVVGLDGQAYFDVAPNIDRPFVVRTGTVVTRVLGTAFDVRHYAEDRGVRVVVRAGKVTVGTERRPPVTLIAGMMARATDSTMSVSRVPDVAPYTGWTSGRLDFQEAPVPEVLATLGRWYGVRFQMADSTLPGRYVTAALDYNTTTDLISAIETILNVSATTARTADGLVITLHPRRRPARTDPAVRRDLSPYTSEFGR